MATAVKRLSYVAQQYSQSRTLCSPNFIATRACRHRRLFASSSRLPSEKSDEPGPRTAGPVDASAIEDESDVLEDANAKIRSSLEEGDNVSAAGTHGDIHRQVDHGDTRQRALQELERMADAGQKLEARISSAMDTTSKFSDPYERDTLARPRASLQRSQQPGQTFWSGPLGDDYGEDDEFEEDDISSLGHGELDQHREMREYARIAAWEMPLLSKLARPFKPPTQATPLRFRTTDYMGEYHPASKKVVLEFCPADLPSLTPLHRSKLIKLCGVRYNPTTEIVKMSCESFETPAQNKRYLADIVNKLLTEARDGTDTFEDVPFDFRHHRPKKKLSFPEEWKMTPERKSMLEERRRERLGLEERRQDGEMVVDGVKVIEKELAAPSLKDPLEREALTVEAGRRALGNKGVRGGPQQRLRL